MTSVKRPAAPPVYRPLAGASGSARQTPRGEAVRAEHRDHEHLDTVETGNAFAALFPVLSYNGEDVAPKQQFDFASGVDVEALDGLNEAQLSKGPGRSVLVQGSLVFVEKTLGALEELAATKAGKALLRGLDATPRKVVVVETTDGNYARADKIKDAWLRKDGTPGKGCDATVYFNPTRETIGGGAEEWMTRPPAVGLFHELRHAYFYGNGLLQPGDTGSENNRELAVVGHPYDADGDPSTPPVVPPQPTENALRAELGLPPRPLGHANPVEARPA